MSEGTEGMQTTRSGAGQQIPSTMKAMVYDSNGPGRMSWMSTFKVPKIAKHEILVKVITSSVNPLDYKIAESHSMFMAYGGKGKVVGRDFAGTIVDVGKGVTGFTVGEHVFGWGAGYAEYAVVSPTEISRIPEDLRVDDFGHYACAAVTAHQILRRHWLDKPHVSVRSILVVGASGGVGSSVIQIARAVGGPEVKITGVCSAKNGDYIKQIGADNFVDYHVPNFDLARAIPVHSIDLIVDVLSGCPESPNYVNSGMLLLKQSGTYVVLNSASGWEWFKSAVSKWTGWNLQKSRYDLHITKVKKSEKDLYAIGRLVAQNKFKLHVAEEIPLLESPIRCALHACKQRHARGKIRIKTEEYGETGFSSPVATGARAR